MKAVEKMNREWFFTFIIEKLRGIKFKLPGRRSLQKERQYYFLYIPIILWNLLPQNAIKERGIYALKKATRKYEGGIDALNHCTYLSSYKLWLGKLQSYWLPKPGNNQWFCDSLCLCCSPKQSASCHKQDPETFI